MNDAIDALERAFGGALPAAPDRSHLDVGTGDLLIMPSWDEEVAGVKLVTVAPHNPAVDLPLIHGVYVLFEKPSLIPVAIFSAAALTALRTAAVSGVATRYLASEGASNLLIFGAGVQARAHLDAMTAVRPIKRVHILSRTPGRAQELVDVARGMSLQGDLGEAADVARAEIICTCTSSSLPLFDGGLLSFGAHVNAVGSYKAASRELDDRTVRRARVVVDTRRALKESGDLIAPIESGALKDEDVRELAEIVTKRSGRTSPTEVTVFKSVGAAFEDLVVAQAVVQAL